MTNEEAIELLNQEKIPMILDGKPNEHLAVAHIKAIEALEENAKLKAEIEQLRWISYENIKTENDTNNRIIKEKESEIEQLKKELEQSVKLPCKVGDMVYDNDFGKPTPSTIVGYSFGNIFQDDYSEIEEEQIYFYSKSNRFNIETSFASSEIGKTIFLNKKEAEQALKGEKQ